MSYSPSPIRTPSPSGVQSSGLTTRTTTDAVGSSTTNPTTVDDPIKRDAIVRRMALGYQRRYRRAGASAMIAADLAAYALKFGAEHPAISRAERRIRSMPTER